MATSTWRSSISRTTSPRESNGAKPTAAFTTSAFKSKAWKRLVRSSLRLAPGVVMMSTRHSRWATGVPPTRSEEHTSELQSLAYLVCRLLLEKKKKIISRQSTPNLLKQHDLTLL